MLKKETDASGREIVAALHPEDFTSQNVILENIYYIRCNTKWIFLGSTFDNFDKKQRCTCIGNGVLECSCYEGWMMEEDVCKGKSQKTSLYITIFNRFFSDVSECRDNLDDCDMNADCFNSEGSYSCICKHGYTGDGKSCTAEECVALPVLAEGIETSSQRQMKVGNTMTYRCRAGYLPLSGSGTQQVTCEPGGTWTVITLRCVREVRYCMTPPTPPEGTELASQYTGRVNVGDGVALKCKSGYVPASGSQGELAMCKPGGTFSRIRLRCKSKWFVNNFKFS